MKKYNSPPIPDQDKRPSVPTGSVNRLELGLIVVAVVAGVIIEVLWFFL